MRNINVARQKLRLALDKDPCHISALVTLAALETRCGETYALEFLCHSFVSPLGRVDRAHELYESALGLDKKNHHLRNAFAQFLRRLGQKDKAKQILRNFLQDHPTSGVSWHLLGELHVEEGALQDARHCFEQGIRTRSEILHFSSSAAFLQTQREHCCAWKVLQSWSSFLESWTLLGRYMPLGRRCTHRHRATIGCGPHSKSDKGIVKQPERSIRNPMPEIPGYKIKANSLEHKRLPNSGYKDIAALGIARTKLQELHGCRILFCQGIEMR